MKILKSSAKASVLVLSVSSDKKTITGKAPPNSSVSIVKNDADITVVAADANGLWTYTAGAALADTDVLKARAPVLSKGLLVGSGSVVEPKPTIGPITASFTIGSTAVFVAFTGLAGRKAVGYTPNDGRLAINAAGTGIAPGLTASSAGTTNYTIAFDDGTTSPLAVTVQASGANGPAPKYANVAASPDNLLSAPPWYLATGVLTTREAKRLVVAPNDGRQFVFFQTVSVETGKTYIFEFSFDKVAGSGAGLPRATFYKEGDAQSTLSTASMTNSGNRYHTYSKLVANFTGPIRINFELAASSDNGFDITVSNLLFGEATAPSYAATDAPYNPPAPAVDKVSLYIGSGKAGLGNRPNYPTLPHHTAATNTAAGRPGGSVTTSFGVTTNLGALTLAAGAECILSEDFRPGGSCDSFDKLRPRYWFETTNGDLNNVETLNDPSHGASWGRMYCIPPVLPDGSTNEFATHVHTADGLELRNWGRNNNAQPWTYGNVVSGGLRSQINMLPGMCGELVTFQEDSDDIWDPWWAYSNYQISPGRVPAANGDAYYGWPTVDGLFWYSEYTVNGVKRPNYNEPDFDDSFTDTGQLKGTQITSHWVHNDDHGDETFYYHIQFIANSDGYTASTDAGSSNIGYKRLNYNGKTKIRVPHATQFNWYGNILDILKDGVLITRLYKEFNVDTFNNLLTGKVDYRGLNEFIGGQWGSKNREDSREGMTRTIDATKQRTTIITHKLWRGNFDLASYGAQPANLLPQYPDLVLDVQTYQPGQQNTFPITNLPQNYKAIATSSDGTVLTVTGANIVGTFPALANGATPPSITVTAAPHVAARADGKNGLGVMLKKSYPLTVGSNSPAAKTPSEIGGNLIQRNNLGEQVGNNSTTGWNHTSDTTITPNQTDRSGTTKAFRMQAPNNGNLEYYLPNHANAVFSPWVKANVDCVLSFYTPSSGTVGYTLKAADGWKKLSGIPVDAGKQVAMFNNGGTNVDILISDANLQPV